MGKIYKKVKKQKPFNEQKYKEFLRKGGALSGVYVISNKKTAQFVKQYKEFIPKKDIYVVDKKGNLVPKYPKRKFWLF